MGFFKTIFRQPASVVSLILGAGLLYLGLGGKLNIGGASFSASFQGRSGLCVTGAFLLIVFGIGWTIFEKRRPKNSSGSILSDGRKGRDEAFQILRKQAKKYIVIVGTGMADLSKEHLRELEDDATRAKIEIFMIDPVYLVENQQLSIELGKLFNKPHFTEDVRKSFKLLKDCCEKWNAQVGMTYRMDLWIYRHPPTFGMVLIDPDDGDAAVMIELLAPGAIALRSRVGPVRRVHEAAFVKKWEDIHRSLRDSAQCVTATKI